MNRYWKLVNFEFNRIAKVYGVMLAITTIAQIAGVIVLSKSYLNKANKAIYEDMVPKEEFLKQTGSMSMLEVTRTLWFLGPIALCVALVAFYIFLIWYRDWVGKNTFIYRLLMLPTSRLNVFFAKITTILAMTLGFVAFQLILFPIESTILKWMVPRDFRMDMAAKEIISSMNELTMIFPHSFIEFLLYYGGGLLVVAILFTAILFERSFRLKGIMLGILYGVLAVAVVLAPVLLMVLFGKYDYLYPLEILGIEVVMGIIVFAGSIWTSGYLLKNKVRV